MKAVDQYRKPRWDDIDTVLLDMDGTLLDLNFDNVFWQEVIPRHYGRQNGLSFEEAARHLKPVFESKQGSLDWYCLDYWSETLKLDVPALKRRHRHHVRYLPEVPEFLKALRGLGKRMVLVTNSNRETLEIKISRTDLHVHFDALYTSHEFGLPKEDREFWPLLQEAEPFGAGRTLLVDDSLPVLRAARAFGMGHLVAVSEPDTGAPRREISEFVSVTRISELHPGDD